MNWGDLFKHAKALLNLNPFTTITGALGWTLLTAATGFIGAIGFVFVTSIRPAANIGKLVQTDEYAVAAILAVFIPLVALMGAIFVTCVIARSLYQAFRRIFKPTPQRKPKSKAPEYNQEGVVTPFQQRKLRTP